jgi:hypothetical protein
VTRPDIAHSALKPVKSWVCPTCKTPVASAYCPACGESPLPARDLSLRALFFQLVHELTSIDGRLVRSLQALFTRPGALTVAYAEGPRKPFLGPIQLFLITNVVFVAVQSLTGTNVFSSTLDSHLHHQDWSALAQRLVAHRLATGPTTLEHYAPLFNQAVALHAKSLVILMALVFALLLPVVFYRKRRSFGVHVVFALHLYAFLLFVFCVSLGIAWGNALCGGAGLGSRRIDLAVSLLNLAVCIAYLHVATGRVYGAKGARSLATSVTLGAAVAVIVLGYRFGLLLFTLRVT